MPQPVPPSRALRRMLLSGALTVLLAGLGWTPGRAADSVPAAAVAQVPEGLWKGQLSAEDGSAHAALAFVLGSVNGAAEARMLLDDGTLAALSITARGRATGTLFPVPGGTETFTGVLENLEPKTAFSGSYRTGAGRTGTFAFSEYLTLYDTPTTVPDMAGAYGSSRTQNNLKQELTLNLHPDGRFEVPGKGSPTMSGAVSVPDPQKSAIRIRYRISGQGAANRSGSGIGYFFADPRDGSRTLLVTGSHGSKGFLAVFEAGSGSR